MYASLQGYWLVVRILKMTGDLASAIPVLLEYFEKTKMSLVHVSEEIAELSRHVSLGKNVNAIHYHMWYMHNWILQPHS